MKHILISLLIAGSSLVSEAAPIVLDTTATTVGHTFVPSASSTVDYIYGSFWGAAPAATFSASLSSADSFQLTIRAPAGSAFYVSSQPGSMGGVLSFGFPLSIWTAPSWNGGPRYSLPTSVSFTDFTGPSWYSDTTGISVDTDGRAVVIEGSLWWSGAPQMSFTSVTLTADLSSLSGYGFPNLTFSPDLAVGIAFQDILPNGQRSDPGPAVRIAAASVPDLSSTAMLALLSFSILFFQSRRRLTRR